jgi:hypothetical protein
MARSILPLLLIFSMLMPGSAWVAPARLMPTTPNPEATAAEFHFIYVGFLDDRALVYVSQPGISVLPSCQPSGTNCSQWDLYATVQPCPLDVPCTNGSYQRHDTQCCFGFNLALEYGTTYQFNGSVDLKYAPKVSGVCQPWSCFAHEDYPQGTVTTPTQAERAHWDVTTESANLDTVWVDAKVATNFANYACYNYCNYYYFKMTVSPPAIGIKYNGAWLSASVSNGVMTHTDDFNQSINKTYRVALAPGHSYTFDGAYQHWSTEYGCVGEGCLFQEDFRPVTYNAAPIPVEPTTWGRVKAFYRSE